MFLTSKAGTSINQSDNNDVLKSMSSAMILSIQKYLGKGLGWIIDSAADHTINISKCNLLSGITYIKLPTELDHSKTWLIFKILMIINATDGI